MQLQAITYFNELVSCRSIRQAAENLGVSAAAVSRQLDNLEYHFGVPLVDRGARGVELTAAGEVVAEHLRSATRSFEQAQHYIDDLRGLRRGKITIHVNGAVSGFFLAYALAEFSIEYPAVRIDVRENSAGAALKAVALREADMALTLFSPNVAGIKAQARVPLDFAAIMASDHPLARQVEIDLEALQSHPLSLPERSFSLRQVMENKFRDAGRPPLEVAYTTSSMAIQTEMALMGSTLLILPEISVRRDIEAGRLVARPLARDAHIDAKLQLSIHGQGKLTFAADKFQRHLERLLMAQFGPNA